MPSQVDRTAGELDWPEFAERTPPRERERTSKYSITLHQAISRLETELLDRVDADDWRLSTAAPHRKSDGMPYADSNPDDPGVAVRWTKDGEQYCVACDRYTALRDNVRTIGLYVDEKRKMSDRPVRTGRDEFSTARLPPGDEDQGVVVAGGEIDDREPHEVLEVAPDASDATIEAVARRKLADVHPDQNEDGDRQEYIRIQKAKEKLLE